MFDRPTHYFLMRLENEDRVCIDISMPVLINPELLNTVLESHSGCIGSLPASRFYQGGLPNFDFLL